MSMPLKDLRDNLWSKYFGQGQGGSLFNETKKWMTIMVVLLIPIYLVLSRRPIPPSTPTPKGKGKRATDGLVKHLITELVLIPSFIFAYLSSPLNFASAGLDQITTAQKLFVGMLLIHCVYRGFWLSPLCSPQTSVTVPREHNFAFSVLDFFCNVMNGFLVGAFAASPYGRITLRSYSSLRFLFGLLLWISGFMGKIAHEEILLDIYLKSKSDSKKKDDARGVEEGTLRPTIPYGLLFNHVSYPQHFCELVAWLGFAIAGSRFPFGSFSPLSLFAMISPTSLFIPAFKFAPTLTPPYIFLMFQSLRLFLEAYRGHAWYRQKFGDAYPEERKAVIPHVL
ncbi:hypothetical protein BDQ17DRAFT_1287771 [Cyathus striatus]|nr:hypothetical protein BDQ17DRAFT_1287771 [Cyathus striatus]